MPDGTPTTAGPAIARSIDEVRGVFPSDGALEDAIARLTLAGFDRADLSLPRANPSPARATPEQGADNPDTGVDDQQMRTLHASMAGSVGAIAAAGAVVMTGGAALPAVAAAAAAGLGAGTIAHAVAGASDQARHADRETSAAHGGLILSARVRDRDRAETALSLMRAAGATHVESLTRGGPGALAT